MWQYPFIYKKTPNTMFVSWHKKLIFPTLQGKKVTWKRMEETTHTAICWTINVTAVTVSHPTTDNVYAMSFCTIRFLSQQQNVPPDDLSWWTHKGLFRRQAVFLFSVFSGERIPAPSFPGLRHTRTRYQKLENLGWGKLGIWGWPFAGQCLEQQRIPWTFSSGFKV